MATAPKRAQDLLLKALAWWEAEHGKVPNVDLVWTTRRAACNCQNWTEPYRITMNVGSRTWARQKLGLLHELGHALAPRQAHTPAFWETAWTLYRWAGLPIKATLRSEGNYKVGARLAYHKGLGHTEAAKRQRITNWRCPACTRNIAGFTTTLSLKRGHLKWHLGCRP